MKMVSEQLPDLSSVYPLSEEQKRLYQRDGHLFLPGVASREEVEAYRPFLTKAAMDYNTEKRPMEGREP